MTQSFCIKKFTNFLDSLHFLCLETSSVSPVGPNDTAQEDLIGDPLRRAGDSPPAAQGKILTALAYTSTP